MGSVHAAALRGFLFPDPRLTAEDINESDTSFDESGPRPGSPVAQDEDSNVELALSGGQSVDVDVFFASAGFPGVSPTEACRAAWKLDSEADTEWRGWSPFSFPHSWFNISTFTANIFPVYDCITIPTTQKVIAISSRADGSTLTGPNSKTLDPADWTWTDNGNVRTLTTTEAARNSCLVVLPNENVLLIEYASTTTPSTFHFWTVYESKDAGATWDVYARNPIPKSTTLFTTATMRACMVGRNMLLMWEDGTGSSAHQYASNSLGARFTQVGTEWTSSAPRFLNVKTMKSGRAAIVYWDGSDVVFKSVGSAYERVEDVDATVIEAAVGSTDHVAMWVDADGAVWVMFFAAGSTHTRLWVSYDEGDTWEDARDDENIRGPFNSGESASYLQFGAGTTSMGRAITLCNLVNSSSSTFDGVCMAIQWGGWSNVEVLGMSDAANGRTWFPYELPDSITPWTLTSTGGTHTLTSPGYMNIVTTAQTRYFSHTSVWGTTPYDMIGYIEIDVVSGGSSTTAQITVRGSQGNGATRGQFDVIFSTTQYAVESNGSGRGTVTHGVTGRLGVIWYYNKSNDKMSTWYRDVESAGNWTQGHDEVDITPFASGASGFYDWGHRTASTSTSRWYANHVLWSTVLGGLKPAYEKLDLVAKTLSAAPYPINEAGTEASAAFLAAIAGPAKRAEEWDVDALHDFGRNRMLPANNPSPTEPWRSLTVADIVLDSVPEQIPIAWDLGVDTFLGEESIGLALLGTNIRSALLQGWNGATWVTLGTWNASKTVHFSRDGDVVTGAAGVDFGRYLFRGELDGAWVDFGSNKRRVIRVQTEGVFDGDVTTRQARLYLEGIDGTEPTSGLVSIYPRNGVLLLHNVAKYDKFRLRILSATTATGYVEIGAAVLGPIAVAGKQWSRGWAWQRSPNAETRRDRKGTTRTRRLGPALKQLSVSWSDGVKMHGIRSGDPDYLQADTGDPLAARDDVAWWLMGLMEQWKSGEVPVVCLTSIPKTSGTTITDPTLFLYSRIVSAVGLDNVTGDEDGAANRKEFLRVPTVTFEEIG